MLHLNDANQFLSYRLIIRRAIIIASVLMRKTPIRTPLISFLNMLPQTHHRHHHRHINTSRLQGRERHLISLLSDLALYFPVFLHGWKPNQNHAPCNVRPEEYCNRIMLDESFGSDYVRMAHLRRFISFFKMLYIPHQTAKTLPAWFVFVLFLVPPPSSASLILSLNLFSSLPRLVEDVSNLTASDVMNRVNLGYLQGNTCAVCDSCVPCEWSHPSCREGLSPFISAHWRLAPYIHHHTVVRHQSLKVYFCS